MTFKFNKRDEETFTQLMNAVEDANDAALEFLNEHRNAWQEAFEEKSEKWKESDIGELMRENIDTLTNLIDALEGLDLSRGNFQ